MRTKLELWFALWRIRRSIGLPTPFLWHWILVKYFVTGKLEHPKGWTPEAGLKYLETEERAQ